MITKQFAFFAFFTGLTMLLSITEIPILSEVGAVGFPIVFIVSGRRYGLYFIMLDTMASATQSVQAFGMIGSMLSVASSKIPPVSQISLPVAVSIIPAYISQIVNLAMFSVVFIIMGYSLRFYVRLLKRVRTVAKHNYRANGAKP